MDLFNILLNLPDLAWDAILPYLNQFNLNTLLRVCKTLHNHPVIVRELNKLMKWCAIRENYLITHPKITNFIDQFGRFKHLVDCRITDVELIYDSRLGDYIHYNPRDIHSKMENLYYTKNAIFTAKFGMDFINSPKRRANIITRDVVLTPASLNIQVLIKVNNPKQLHYLFPVNQFKLRGINDALTLRI